MQKKSVGKDSRHIHVDEKGFKLPLKTVVIGSDKSGQAFQEETSLSYISHNGSSFILKTPVSLGNELKLVIDLPPDLSKNEDLKLIIKGKIVFLEAPKDQNSHQRVSLNFENKYVIKPDNDS
jgi:hypothetical protein